MTFSLFAAPHYIRA